MSEPRRAPWLIGTSWCILLAALAAIYWVSDRAVPLRPGFSLSDKLLHYCAYWFLASLWLAALRATWPAAGWPALAWLAALLAAAYGATDEWHQSFVEGRTADVWDWVADAAGAATLATLVTAWAAWRRRSRPARGE